MTFNFKIPATSHWPATDADFAKGGIYDQNTEAGKRKYEEDYFKFEVPLHSDPGAYMPTLLGYTWLTADKFTDEQLVWAANEYYRQVDVEAGMGGDITPITNRFAYIFDELKKRKIDVPVPTFVKDSKLPPTPPFYPSRGR